MIAAGVPSETAGLKVRTTSPADATATMDEQAFHACYRRTAGPLRAYVVRAMGSVSQADDIVQEAYLRLLRVERPPDEPAAQRALLIRIASNLMVDHWRRTRHERSETGAAPEVAANSPDLSLRLDMARVFGGAAAGAASARLARLRRGRKPQGDRGRYRRPGAQRPSPAAPREAKARGTARRSGVRWPWRERSRAALGRRSVMWKPPVDADVEQHLTEWMEALAAEPIRAAAGRDRRRDLAEGRAAATVGRTAEGGGANRVGDRAQVGIGLVGALASAGVGHRVRFPLGAMSPTLAAALVATVLLLVPSAVFSVWALLSRE